MADNDQARATRWLGLSAAARVVGAHPSTLREWAERGLVTHIRTPGGHRRFALEDLHAFVVASTRASTALAPLDAATSGIADRALAQIHSGPMQAMPWHAAHSPREVERKREQGRRLLGLALHYVSRQSGRDNVLHEAEEIGGDYGRDAVADHLPLSETVQAFFFFRDSLIRATRPSGTPPGRFDDEDVRINHDLRVFLDAVFYAMLAAYEQTRFPSLPAERES